MKKFSTFLMLAIFAMGVAFAETSSLVFKAQCKGAGTADDGASWTITSDATESTYEALRGIHFGTNGKPVSFIQFSTSAIKGTITQIVVNASSANGKGTVSATVGGATFGEAQNLSKTQADYTLTGSASGEIVIKVEKPSSKKGLYVKSVTVTYTPEAPATKGEAELAFPQKAYTATMGEEFSTPALTNPHNLAVTYNSSMPAVATVDPATGAITLVGKGETTITATSQETDAFLAGMASYVLTVNEAVNTGVEATATAKTAIAVSYMNVAGAVSHVPFSGLNIVKTVYSDGTTSVVKAIVK